MIPEDFLDGTSLDFGVKKAVEFLIFKLPKISNWRPMECEIRSEQYAHIFLRRNTPDDDKFIDVTYTPFLEEFPGRAEIKICEGGSHNSCVTATFSSGSWSQVIKSVAKFLI